MTVIAVFTPTVLIIKIDISKMKLLPNHESD